VAKKKKGKDKKDKAAHPATGGSRADAVRTAAAQAVQSAAGQAQLTRERAQDLADELSGAATRVRATLDDLRPPTAEDVKGLRADLARLEERVDALEARPARAGARGGSASRRSDAAAKQTAAAAQRAAAKAAAARRPPRRPPDD
jgi:polyhydroxyalkanoate synthesis regulator phasin